MKRSLLLIFALVCTFAVKAQSLDYLTVRTMEGTEQSFSLDQLKLTFADGKVVATSKGETTTFDFANLDFMFFTTEPTAIEKVSDGGCTVSIVGGNLQTNAPAGSTIHVFTPDGKRVGQSSLNRGVYLVQINGRTYKTIAR